ncbi:hypothetical protein BJ741DRAFT_602239 [Chytriomyces cf. hyalinus JEL632]|nr:hypothetical protein BJ741DRAFT_602239 [Chytriomyces cf. hyalinus JEL632]
MLLRHSIFIALHLLILALIGHAKPKKTPTNNTKSINSCKARISNELNYKIILSTASYNLTTSQIKRTLKKLKPGHDAFKSFTASLYTAKKVFEKSLVNCSSQVAVPAGCKALQCRYDAIQLCQQIAADSFNGAVKVLYNDFEANSAALGSLAELEITYELYERKSRNLAEFQSLLDMFTVSLRKDATNAQKRDCGS